MSPSDCLLCGSLPKDEVPLTKIIESFRTILQILESNALKGAEKQINEEKLRDDLEEEKARNHVLEEERNTAQERSDKYKKRFIEAQQAIQTLHEQNVKLSKQFKQPETIAEVNSFPFATVTSKKLSPETRKQILAPDTCYLIPPNKADVIYISSDEEDFRHNPKKTKSPRRSQQMRKEKSPTKKKKMSPKAADSFFAIPKHPVLVKIKTEKSEEREKREVDMDETRMDVDVGVKRENESTFAEDLDDTRLLNDHEEHDSIPASPVLSSGREKRFGAFRSGLVSIPKYGGGVNMTTDGEKSPSILDRQPLFPKRTGNEISTKDEILKPVDNSKEEMDGGSDSQGWHRDHPPQDSLSLIRRKSQKSRSEAREYQRPPGNTSLDDLFDRTDGDLETTSALNNTTCDNEEASDDDEDLDALLLEGVNEAEGSYLAGEYSTAPENVLETQEEEEPGAEIRPMPMMDSFDVVPKRNKNKPTYKYQEVVRKQDERRKLDGKACAQCDAYYDDLPEEEKKRKLKEVCRHKHVYVPPSTPENFWEVEFPSTEECIKRGYIADHTDLPTQVREQQVPRLRRKKPLEANFKAKSK